MDSYNRPSYTTEEYRRNREVADFQPALHVGMPAPDFSATALDGSVVHLSDFTGRTPVVFEFGCITGPIFINDLTTLSRLNTQFPDVQFLVIYTREVHAGEHYGYHRSFEQKLDYARDLKRLENLEFPVLVDSLAGDAHRLYGLRPAPVYVVDREGLIVHKSSLLNPEALELAITQLLRWEQMKAEGIHHFPNVYSETWTRQTVNPLVHQRVFARTGHQAQDEVRQVFGFDPANPTKQ